MIGSGINKDLNGTPTGLYSFGNSQVLDGTSTPATYENETEFDQAYRGLGIGSTTAVTLTGETDANSMLWPDLFIDYFVIPAGATLTVYNGKLQLTQVF